MGDYRERLRVPLAWWLLAMPSALIFGATLYAGLTGPWPVIIMAVLVAGCAVLLITLGLGSLEIRDGTLRSSASTRSRPRGCAARRQTRRLACTRDLTSRKRSTWRWSRRARRALTG